MLKALGHSPRYTAISSDLVHISIESVLEGLASAKVDKEAHHKDDAPLDSVRGRGTIAAVRPVAHLDAAV